MKKLFLIVLALNFAACSNDTENTAIPTAVEKTNTIDPNPRPEDYNSAEFLSFKKTTSKISSTSKVASFVSTVVPDAALRNKLLSIGAAIDNSSTTDNIILLDSERGGLD